jgi:asparagine synthase (glutamine-hydrolysing)
MCGIAGRFGHNGLDENIEWAQNASTLLRHRGPDGEGFFTDPFCQLVHRRLSIIDLTNTGDQPMTNEDRSIWIVFNGEIYGYETLRRDLIQKGHIFRGTSDTEVLLHLYEECGTDLFSRIKGIYAFAIYDQRKKSLLLARDRFGTKPLYYAFSNGQWIFASELKAILAWKGISPEIDRQACYDFLSWGYIPEPATGFQNIFALSKGSFLHIQQDRHIMQQYHAVTPQPDFSGSVIQAVETVSEKLQEAVRYQKVADVPVGSLLSGGIDSGLVTAAYSKVNPNDFFTFTVGFPDAGYDESDLAAKTARHLGTSQTVISCADWQLKDSETIELLAHFDQPFSDTSLFAVNLVSKGIHDKGLRCAFSGDGGDEAFGGYAFFGLLRRLLPLQRLPDITKVLALVGNRAIFGRVKPGSARQVRRALDISKSKTTSQFLSQLVSYMTETQKQELVLEEARGGLLQADRLFEPFEQGWGLEDVSSQLTAVMFALSLPGEMLKKVDMMSMKNSVEIRVPLLDEALVDFAAHLPYALKTTAGQNKRVLRALAERWLPVDVSRAKKHGFGIPLDILAAQSLKQVIKECLLSPHAHIHDFLDTAKIQHWVDLFENRSSDLKSRNQYALEISREGLYQRLFFLLSLELWMQKYHLNW